MSYVLQVWESPRPTSLEEADDILGRLLADKVVRPRPRLMALAKALWNQFPSDPSTAPNDPIWADSSLSKPHDGSPLLTLGISTRHLNVLVPFVAAAATTNGLTVYDPQFGTVYLPDGRTFGNLPSPPGEADDSLDRDEARELVAEELTEFMRAQGFEWTPVRDRRVFVTNFDGGGHSISISPALLTKYVEFDVISTTHLQKIDDVIVRLGLAKPGHKYSSMLCGLGTLAKREMPTDAARWLGDTSEKFRTTGRSSLPAMCRDIKSALHGALLPLLDRVRSIESLWTFALEEAGVPEDHRRATLNARAIVICGWLLGDDRYRDVANSKREALAVNLAAAARWGSTAAVEEEQANFESFMTSLEALRV
jgi:hypothetical protein